MLTRRQGKIYIDPVRDENGLGQVHGAPQKKARTQPRPTQEKAGVKFFGPRPGLRQGPAPVLSFCFFFIYRIMSNS